MTRLKKSDEKMKIAVVGPGGVGGYFGALLARAGRDVFFLGRGEHLRAIREKGLTVKSDRGDFHVEINATVDPTHIGPCHLILFCVKSFDTETVAEWIRPLVASDAVIISLQNGVDNEETIGRTVGIEKVMGGVAFIGSRIEAPGVILHTAAGQMTFGELSGGPSERGRVLLGLFEEAGIEARLSEDIKKVIWRKMVWNCGFNAITALTRTTAAEVLACPETREIVRKTMGEVLSVAQSKGVDLKPDLPGKTMAHTEKEGEIKTSMLMDMEKGKPMEIDALNGTICRIGKEKGISTPVNDLLYSLISVTNAKRGTGQIIP